LENLGREKEIFTSWRQKKREISLKETSRSTWEYMCFLEVDLVDKVGKFSLEIILGKSIKCRYVGGMCEEEWKSLKSTEMKRHQFCN
jgi:hypothetical protein